MLCKTPVRPMASYVADPSFRLFSFLGESDSTIMLKWRSRIRLFSPHRSEEHKSELQSLMRISYAVFCLKKKKYTRVYILNLTYTRRHCLPYSLHNHTRS